MAFFINNNLLLVREDRAKGITFFLGAPVVLYLDDVRFVVVDKYFKTNLASIPKLVWWWFPPTGMYDKAAIVHDYLYRGGFVSVEGCGSKYVPSREEADAIFLAGLEALGVSLLRRRAMHIAVRVFGHQFYKA